MTRNHSLTFSAPHSDYELFDTLVTFVTLQLSITTYPSSSYQSSVGVLPPINSHKRYKHVQYGFSISLIFLS